MLAPCPTRTSVETNMTSDRRPLLFSIGFRPFFLLAAVAAIAVVARTVSVLHGVAVPAGNPFAWHGHEMLFGFVAAVIAGFLLTAMPNWTGTTPVAGAPLAALAALWLLGRTGLWAGWPEWWAIAADAAFLPAVALIVSRPLWRGGPARHWLPIAILLLLAAANGLWHAAAWLGQPALTGRALAFATMLVALMIAVMGGRIVPAFTRTHLERGGAGARPRAGDWRDPLALGASAVVAAAEYVAPEAAAALALVAAAAHALRLHGWCGLRVLRDPLLFVLHVGYAWLAIGYAVRGLALLGPQWGGAWALHGLLVGAIGTMILAMLARVTLGHTGRALRAGLTLTTAFIAIQGAAVVRLLDFWLGADAWRVAGALWVLAFGLYLVRCGPMLVLPRADATPGGIAVQR